MFKHKLHIVISALILLLLSSAFVVVGHSHAHAEIVDRIVARVQDKIITLYELEEAITPYVLQQGINPAVLDDEQRRQSMMQEVLNDMVERTLLMHEAEKLDLSVSDEEVEQWLAYTRQQQNLSAEDFRNVIAQYGLDYEAYREMIRENLLRMRLINIQVGAKVNISESDVDAQYRARFGGDNATEVFRTIYHILIQPQSGAQSDVDAARARAEDIYAKLEDGQPFDELAEQENPPSLAGRKGLLGTFRQGDLDPEFAEAAFQVEQGEYSPVVQTRFGFHIIHIADIEERVSEDVAQQREKIRQELHQAQMERQLKSYVQNLKARSYVDMRL